MYPFFLSERTITVIMKFRYVIGTYYKVEVIFSRSLHHYQSFRKKIYVGRLKRLAESSEQFRHVSLQLVVCKTASSGVHPSGDQKGGSRRVLNRISREKVGEEFSPLLLLLP